jgi:hypothetical protein
VDAAVLGVTDGDTPGFVVPPGSDSRARTPAIRMMITITAERRTRIRRRRRY